MCGLVGVIAWDERHAVSRDQLARMSATIAHRGPDGEGTYLNEDRAPGQAACGLAHRRLAILDPDPRSNQPFSDASGKYLVYNGEIYNFRELRAELSKLRPDYAWRTNGDTEVLLVAYDVWAEACVEKFDGMFAFAIWDSRQQTLFLARDRMGQKPLYLAFSNTDRSNIGAIAFSSELAALRALPWMDATIDDSAIGHYLRWGYIPSPLTIHRGCEKLPPAHWMRVRANSVEVRQYFDPNQTATLTDASVANVRRLITDAVKRQLVSDVPLGCFLSGGIDSSIIAAAMKASVGANQDVLTFSIGFDDPRYDETRYAAEVARHLGTRHHQFTVRPNAAEDLSKLAAVFGEPFGDSSALPTHYLARETRNHVKVALSGDGGDELFAGYDRYRAMLLGESVRSMPPALRDFAAAKFWDHLPGTHPKSKIARLKRMLASLHLQPPQRYDSYLRLFDDAAIAELMPGRSDASTNWLVHAIESLAANRDIVQTAMAVDRVTYLPEDLLTKVDRASMLHALEVRSPFMDPAIVRFAAQLSTQQLLGSTSGARAIALFALRTPAKRLLREAFAGMLPPQLFTRPKMGFAVPIGDWFRGDLRDLLNDSLNAPNSVAATRFNAAAVHRLIDDHQQNRADHSQRLYALLMLELSFQQNRNG